MSTKDDRAFPLGAQVRSDGEVLSYPEGGVTVREYFAAMAMQGLIAADPTANGIRPEIIAGWAVDQADALLKRLADSADEVRK